MSLVIGLIFALGVIAAGWLLLMERKPDVRVSSAPLLTRTVIICGECGLSPDGSALPIKTRLTIRGLCSGCGGRSFVLASKLAPILAQRMKREREVKEYSDLNSFARAGQRTREQATEPACD